MPGPTDTPQHLRPYLFHRCDLSWKGENDAIGTCPFCGREGKFFVSQKSGLYQCKVCVGPATNKSGGNAFSFLRNLHASSSATVADLEPVAEDRKVSVERLQRWGLVKSAIDGEWILPTYGFRKSPELPSEISNLYRWTPVKGKRRLLTTSNFQHGLFGLQFWDQSKPDVFINEGPWDAMALEEVLMAWKEVSGRFIRTADITQSFYARTNILAVPGAGTFREEWPPIFSGKNVTLMFDNDHPRLNDKTNKLMPPTGFEGLKSAAKKLRPTAASIRVLDWGPEGFDASLPSGHDVRDILGVVYDGA